MHHHQRQCCRQLHGEIAVGNAVQRVVGHAAHPQCVRHHLAVQRIGGGRQRAAAQRRHIHAGDRVVQPADVAQQHFGVRHQMVPKGDGLRPLQMGVARHDRVCPAVGLLAQHADQLHQLRPQRRDRIFEIQPNVQRHLIVAAAPGVQPFARVADARGQFAFHKGVDVLGVRVNGQRAGSQIRSDRGQPVADGFAVRCRDNALLRQHCGVRHAAGNVLLCHAAVKRDGGVKVVGFLVKLLVEPSCPQLHNATPFGKTEII